MRRDLTDTFLQFLHIIVFLSYDYLNNESVKVSAHIAITKDPISETVYPAVICNDLSYSVVKEIVDIAGTTNFSDAVTRLGIVYPGTVITAILSYIVLRMNSIMMILAKRYISALKSGLVLGVNRAIILALE